MSGAAEHLEHAEHVAHAGHDAGNPIGRLIGITMAVLGVILAFCSAQVGGSRTELITKMVEQSAAHAKYQAQAIKYRVSVSQLQGLRAILVTEKEAGEVEETIKKLAAGDNTDGVIQALAASTRRVISAGSPRKAQMLGFVSLVRKYRLERDAGQAWTEAYDGAIHGYTLAAERFETAQLAAEVGIILASIALLVSNRKIWYLSLLLGVASLGTIGWTFSTTGSKIAHSETEIEETKAHYTGLRKAQDEKANDEKLLNEIEGLLGEAPKPRTPAPAEHGEGEHRH